jgi:hypothetical protein
MFEINPFAILASVVPLGMMKAYIVLMFCCVFLGTVFDVIHKRSAAYFFSHWTKSQTNAAKKVDGGTLFSILIRAGLVDVMTSAEFCNFRRRLAHLLTMYGFIFNTVSTVLLVFNHVDGTNTNPALLSFLWWLGALMICVGGYWFWFFIRVDVAAEGQSPWRIVRADLFVLSLLGSATFALLWAWSQISQASLTHWFFGLYIGFSTLLFVSVPWSKFAHMFFKPAAAVEKRLSVANGWRNNLPEPAQLPEKYGSARTTPNHY